MPRRARIVVPQSEGALAETFRDAHSTCGRWFNRKYGLSGHLWQGRFYSCVLDEAHLWSAVRYVERNPVRAGIRSEERRVGKEGGFGLGRGLGQKHFCERSVVEVWRSRRARRRVRWAY